MWPISSYFNPKVVYAKAGEIAEVIAEHGEVYILKSKMGKTFSTHINNLKLLNDAEKENINSNY